VHVKLDYVSTPKVNALNQHDNVLMQLDVDIARSSHNVKTMWLGKVEFNNCWVA
jgi:hypothetical protein